MEPQSSPTNDNTMILNRSILATVAAVLTLGLDARCQSDDFAVSLTRSATSCGLTTSFSGPANGTAILFAGRTGGAPVSTPYGTLHISNGFVRLRSIKLSPTGTGSASFTFPNNATVGLQAALVDAHGNLTSLSSYGAITLKRSPSGGALAGAWTIPQSGPERVQVAIEADQTVNVQLRVGSQTTPAPALARYVHPWRGWHVRPLSPSRIFAVYLDGVYVGLIYL